MVAVDGIPNSIPILGLDFSPVIKRAIDRDPAWPPCSNRRANALESAHPACQLVIVVIGVASAHGFAIPAVFLSVFIHKQAAGIIAILVGVMAPSHVASRNPLIPACHENKAWVNVKRSPPLLIDAGPGVFGNAFCATPTLICSASPSWLRKMCWGYTSSQLHWSGPLGPSQ